MSFETGSMDKFAIELTLSRVKTLKIKNFIDKNLGTLVLCFLLGFSIISFIVYSQNGLALKYNDARSHLDIGRRVVEGLKPGVAQLGSVWLPLPHILMVPTIWNDFFWHSGLSGALISMVSFVGTGLFIYKFLEKLGVGILGKLVGVGVFIANLNILYLQSTAMTESLLLLTMTAGVYYLTLWARDEKLINLVKSAFWIMISTVTRYDGWFLAVFASVLVGFIVIRKKGIKAAEGNFVFFATLAGFGIFLWFLWNLLIFKDPFYFAFGEFSARTQQTQLEAAGELPTKGNLFLSFKAYFFALVYNTYTYPFFVGIIGFLALIQDKKINWRVRLATLALFGALIFNVIALYMGHSVLFLPEIIGKTWFNVRYGVMLLPMIAISFGYLVERAKNYRFMILGVFFLVSFFAFVNQDAVVIDDAVYGSSQKNVTEVAGWLRKNVLREEGYVLISAASHDAIIFSSGLPMKKFIHEGTGAYWDYAVENPDKWAKWIVMRTYDMNDLTYNEIHDAEGLEKYELVDHYPFADIYRLKSEYISEVITKPILGKIK
ncbi:MAG: Glycosyl transferase family 2 [Candidatus Woesebacteria bacterium GW2011_GWB1_39_12]|uniref:Glycosyl transferase family 2 n=1 Tax=Candidatus Woesebacteria bacterium GW2011_GWB1_39_12 TaxID=1618574 RepID=A0A0G0MKH9_9BACT|nr:MAG: Glycosyl transferase family 2 [Candidatus Woesebacteria bacterium GW2011_GWB1_39_12]